MKGRSEFICERCEDDVKEQLEDFYHEDPFEKFDFTVPDG